MEKSSGFRTGRHVIFDLSAHLVFIPKCRGGVITPRVFKVLQETWVTVCEDFEGTLVESNYEADHVHLLVSYPPKVSLSALINSLKGVSARKIRQADFEEVSKALWSKHFWSPSYCALSWGEAPLELIKKYVRQQSET